MKKALLLTIPALLTSVSLFAEGEPPAPGEQGMWQTLIMIAIAIVFFYFIMWRPEQKRRQALDNQRDTLKQGDKVVAMGIIGTVLRLQETTVILKMYDGAKIEVLKGAVTDVLPKDGAAEEAE